LKSGISAPLKIIDITYDVFDSMIVAVSIILSFPITVSVPMIVFISSMLFGYGV